MDQAQIAREMARGHGFSTLMIRPAQVQQLQANGREINLSRVADTFHPPLQPAIWAGIFSPPNRGGASIPPARCIGWTA